MRLTELIDEFYIWASNEEKELLDQLKEPRQLTSFTEHEQVILERLIRKSLVKKIGFNNPVVMTHDKQFSDVRK